MSLGKGLQDQKLSIIMLKAPWLVGWYTAADALRQVLASGDDTYDSDNDDDVIPPSGEGEDRKPAPIFTCHRKTNQWPKVLFYSMLDVAWVATFVI